MCDWLKDELIENLKKIKGDKKGTFLFGNLLVCLMLYLTKEFPSTGPKDFGYDILVGKQLQETFTSMWIARDNNIIDYFKTFQSKMRARERIPQSIVEKYDKKIWFVIKRDEALMEAISPRTIWVTKMGYEVDLHTLEMYAKALLDAPREPSEDFFENAEKD